ncbi:hypothetical protein [Ammoniphilus sp. 3BR4]|uniref:hypothetical protein n=1 Tax=Ammoniphilus sp. 3BR4 TaxID=3158265 RepID=UPI00346588EA
MDKTKGSLEKSPNLNHKVLIDMMIQICEKGVQDKTMKGKHVVDEFVRRLRLFYD